MLQVHPNPPPRPALWGEEAAISEERQGDGPPGASSSWASLPSLPTDLLVFTVLRLLPERELCSVACCSRILRPLAEADANWSRLFAARFPRLVLILERAQPEWWRGAAWRQRYAALCCGAPFHAQVYNREQENDQEDFMLSCYDATLRLTSPLAALAAGAEPTFCASYLAMGKMPAVHEQGVPQRRLRAVPVHCPPMEVFGGDGQAVAEGDEVEVQWKGRRSHPFGWWFGRVRSIDQGRVTLEFIQYPLSSVWRHVKAPIRRGEEAMVNGDSTFGFIGGLRRLAPEEVSEWWQHCPPHRIWQVAAAERAQQLEEDAAAALHQEEEAEQPPPLGEAAAVLGAVAAALDAAAAAAGAVGDMTAQIVAAGEGAAGGGAGDQVANAAAVLQLPLSPAGPNPTGAAAAGEAAGRAGGAGCMSPAAAAAALFSPRLAAVAPTSPAVLLSMGPLPAASPGKIGAGRRLTF